MNEELRTILANCKTTFTSQYDTKLKDLIKYGAKKTTWYVFDTYTSIGLFEKNQGTGFTILHFLTHHKKLGEYIDLIFSDAVIKRELGPQQQTKILREFLLQETTKNGSVFAWDARCNEGKMVPQLIEQAQKLETEYETIFKHVFRCSDNDLCVIRLLAYVKPDTEYSNLIPVIKSAYIALLLNREKIEFANLKKYINKDHHLVLNKIYDIIMETLRMGQEADENLAAIDAIMGSNLGNEIKQTAKKYWSKHEVSDHMALLTYSIVNKDARLIKHAIEKLSADEFNLKGQRTYEGGITREYTLYELACMQKNLDCVKYLLQKGIDLKIFDFSNQEPVFAASAKYDKDYGHIIKYLFSEQKLIAVDWNYALRLACKYNMTSIVEYYAAHRTNADDSEKVVHNFCQIILKTSYDLIKTPYNGKKEDKKSKGTKIVEKLLTILSNMASEGTVTHNDCGDTTKIAKYIAKICAVTENESITKQLLSISKELNLIISEEDNIDSLSATTNQSKAPSVVSIGESVDWINDNGSDNGSDN